MLCLIRILRLIRSLMDRDFLSPIPILRRSIPSQSPFQ
jgi:hypothetical protein